ncbi:ABC transporter ATP-binding protein [Candidatus Uhrbacteria bacterium]|nr:ABC transporter ATP-binding protein [Candidatus Uhrbacteria bacterium]
MKPFSIQDFPFSYRELLKTLWRFLTPYRGRFLVAASFRLVGDIAWLFPAFGMAKLVEFFTGYHTGASLETLWIILGLWAVASVLRQGGKYFSRTVGYYTTERAAQDAQTESMDHLFRLDLAWHEKENAGNKLKRIDRGSEAINRILRSFLDILIEVAVNIVGMVIILASVDLTISLATSFFVLIFYLISARLGPAANAAAQECTGKEEILNGVLFEGINNIRTVKVLNLATGILARVRKASEQLLAKLRQRIWRFQQRGAILNLWANFFLVAALSAIGWNITQGHYAVGFLILFYGYFNRVYDAVAQLTQIVEETTVSKYSVGRMMDILNTPVSPEESLTALPFPRDWKCISLKDVGFSYGGSAVLRGLTFDINRGQRIGIIGLSGAGKSTLFKLLLKENEQYTGEILVDDIPLRSIKKSSYYKQAAVVLQETEVFNFTLRENITIANPSDAKHEKDIKQALDVAHVTPFLSRLPDGLDTMIGEKGVKLSGGERQRVGIARAVFKKPTLLFLDEATSHLDLESEENIRESLHEFFQSVTAIVIAHRLTTIKEMDRILVLEKGKLIEEGSFKELYDKGGRFYQLWEKQKLVA